jgi:arylsulfatase A-like enzyme
MLMNRSAVRNVWIWALLTSLAVAFGAGIHAVLPNFERHQYFHFHLYYTALRLLAQEINRSIPYAFAIFLAPVLLYGLSSRFMRRSGNGWRILLALAPPAVAGLVALIQSGVIRSLPHRIDQLLSLGNAAGVFFLSPTGLSCSVAILAVGAIAVLKSRGAKRMKESRSPTDGRLLRAARAILLPLFIATVLGMSAAFLAVNLATGALKIRNTLDLRGQPNIIFIMVDTLRADRLGCYGQDLPLTPNIDRLAGEGLRFEQAVAQASWTLPSVTSLFTSRYPDWPLKFGGAGIEDSVFYTEYYPTLAEVLYDRGYVTNAIVSNPFLAKTSRNMQGYEYYDDRLLYGAGEAEYTRPAKAPTEPANVPREELSEATSEQLTDLALARLNALRDRKFFLFLLYMDPHHPYLEHEGFEYGVSEYDRRTERSLPTADSTVQLAVRRDELRRYNSEIGYTDFHIGRLLDGLRRQGLYEDTLIVFFSDHGEEFLEHGGHHHQRTIYEEVIQVPLIVKLPRQGKGNSVQGTFPLIDLYPSLLDYLRIDYASLGLQGDAASLASLVRCANKPVYSSTVTLDAARIHSVFVDGYKYIRTEGAEPVEELYHLATDPGEQHNIMKKQTMGEQLRATLANRDAILSPSDRAYLTKALLGQTLDSPEKPAPAVLRKLRSLGYL